MEPRDKKGSTRAWGLMSCALAGMIVLSGCHTDMWIQPKYKPQSRSDFFTDEQSSRPLVSHTVSRAQFRSEDPSYTGYSGGKLLDAIPADMLKKFPGTKAMLLRGQDRFNINCSPCHGRLGDGNGMIAQRGRDYWQILPASYHTDRLRKMPVGHFYDVITNGYGVMYSYAARVQDPQDRWAIAAYIRALQLSQNAVAADVPADELGKLKALPPGQKGIGNERR